MARSLFGFALVFSVATISVIFAKNAHLSNDNDGKGIPDDSIDKSTEDWDECAMDSDDGDHIFPDSYYMSCCHNDLMLDEDTIVYFCIKATYRTDTAVEENDYYYDVEVSFDGEEHHYKYQPVASITPLCIFVHFKKICIPMHTEILELPDLTQLRFCLGYEYQEDVDNYRVIENCQLANNTMDMLA